MKTVFIGGSRHLPRLNDRIKAHDLPLRAGAHLGEVVQAHPPRGLPGVEREHEADLWLEGRRQALPRARDRPLAVHPQVAVQGEVTAQPGQQVLAVGGVAEDEPTAEVAGRQPRVPQVAAHDRAAASRWSRRRASR